MRGLSMGSVLLVACGSAAPGSTIPRSEPTVAEPASRYFLVADVSEISEGASARDGTALIVRASDLEGEREGGEPGFASLDVLASEITERAYDETSDDPEDQVMDALARDACASDERVPAELRVGASVDVLGGGGWEHASITGCTGYAYGHDFYFAFFVDPAAEGAVLASVDVPPRAEGTYRALPPILPTLSATARASVRDQLTRLGLTGALSSAGPEDIGTFELPDGRVLVHVGVPADDAEEGETIGREACGAEGSCVATVVLAFDAPAGEASIVHCASDQQGSIELDGAEGGVWSVLGVFQDGPALGIVSAYENLGERVLVVTRWREGSRERQTIYSLQSG